MNAMTMKRLVLVIFPVLGAVLIGLSLRASAETMTRPGLAPPVSLLYRPVEMILTPRASRTPELAPPLLPAGLLTKPAEPLFDLAERENLKALGAADLALSLKLEVPSPAAGLALKAWCKKRYPNWVIEENGKAEIHQAFEDQLQRFQWGISNAGTAQGFVLDTHRVGTLPALAGQDVGALRARPEIDAVPGRAKTIVAVLDTGIDYDRDASGKITGGHPEFKGQLIDKTGRGDECDPGDASTPEEQRLEGPKGRRARFKACVAEGATDCLTRPGPDGRPDFDRDRNGYPLDCLGWNLTASLTKAIDPRRPTDPPKPTDFFKATDLAGDDDTRDKLGHGTHVSGIIAAAADGEGTRGVVTKNVAILPVKVVDKAPNQPIIPQEISCSHIGGPESHDLFAGEETGMCSKTIVRDLIRATLEIPGSRTAIRSREQLASREEAQDPSAPPPQPQDDLNPQERVLNPGNAPLGFTDQIARGVLYAIRSKANIISMSLAWTSDADSELMKRMTQLARDRGILIVASAGNDSTEARTMPCQYSSVICVASHGPAGVLSYFSNYGSAVDVAAPGENILSTWPRSMKTPRKWTAGPPGYEQKSGTSMAAPMVAGVLARLLNDGYRPDEAQARLYAGTRPLSARSVCESHQPLASTLCADPANLHPAVRTGNVDLASSENAQEAPVIMPDPKGPVQVSWDPSRETAPFSISLKNYWRAAVSPRVELKLETDEEPTLAGSRIELLSPASFSNWEPLETKTIQAQLRFAGDLKTRLKLNGRFFVTVRVTSANAAPRSFEIPFELVATIDQAHPFPGATELAIEGNPAFGGDVLTVVSRDGNPAIEYVALDADQNGATMRLFRELPAQPTQRFRLAAQTNLEKIPNATRLADIQRVDHTFGQPSGYVLIWETKPAGDGNISGLRFDFFDHDLKPLKDRLLRYDNIVSGIDDAHYVWLKYGDKKVPAWVGFGLLPKEEYPDPDFYPAYYVGQSDPDDQRTMQALREAGKVSHTREQGRRILFDSMKALGQDHFPRNRFYFLEPVERKEHDPATGAETGDIKAIARTGGVSPKAPNRRNLRTRDPQQAAAPDFHSFVPVGMLAQTAEERKAGSVRLLLATPELNTARKEISALRYAIGTVKELKTTDPSGERPWIIDDLAMLLDPKETKNLAGLPDVSRMIPLRATAQGNPTATFFGHPLELGRYEANMVVPSTRSGTAYRNDGTRAIISLPEVRTERVDPPAPTDSVFHAAGVFQGSSRLAMFGETHYDVQYNDLTTKERASASLGRFSFMPQATVSKSLMPVVVRDENGGGELLPAMLIPAQIRSSANLEVIIPSYNPMTHQLERLITPARLRLQAGQGCHALQIPTQATEQTGPALMFLCGSRFIQVPLAY